MWELDHKESWAWKNWCFQTVVLEKTLECPWDSKEIKQVNPKRNQPWILIGRTDAEAAAPVLWSPDAKEQIFGKHPDAGKGWKHEAKGMTEDEMVGWHHQLNRHESEETPGDGEKQGSLVCCSLWSCKQSGMCSQLNNNNKGWINSVHLINLQYFLYHLKHLQPISFLRSKWSTFQFIHYNERKSS